MATDQTSYSYEPLVKERHHLRLLRILPRDTQGTISCELTVYDEQEGFPDYVALSYAWGPESDEHHTVLMNGKTFMIRDNLFRFLGHATIQPESMPKLLWIDAVCINQSDTNEKLHQVAQMANIYRNAESVLVWLGAAHYGSDEIMSELHHFSVTGEDDLSLVRRLSVLSLFALCNRTYWQRLWVFQELMLAQNIQLMCGGYMAPWDSFVVAVQRSQNYLTGEHPTDRLNLFQGVWSSPCALIASQVADNQKNRSLFDLIMTTKHLHCSETHDKIYALLGIAGQGHNQIQADYRRPLIHVLNDVLRNRHHFCPPADLREVEAQCRSLKDVFGVEMCGAYNPLSTRHSLKPDPHILEQYPLTLREYPSLSLWWVISYDHDSVESLLASKPPRMINKFRGGTSHSTYGRFFARELLRVVGECDDLHENGAVVLLLALDWVVAEFNFVAQQRRAFHRAISSGRVQELGLLLSRTTSAINHPNHMEFTPLALACRDEVNDAVQLLLADPRCNVNAITSEMDTPLHIALETGNLTIIRLLLEHPSCDIHAVNGAQQKPLAVIQAKDDIASLELLLAHPAANCADFTAGSWSLNSAISTASPSFLECLLNSPVGRNMMLTSMSESDQDLLELALERGNEGVVRVLLRTDSDLPPKWRGRGGSTPLVLAMDVGGLSMVKLLMDHEEIIPGGFDRCLNVALMHAIQTDHADVVEYLTNVAKHRLNFNYRSMGDPPLIVAARQGNIEIVHILLQTAKIDAASLRVARSYAAQRNASWGHGNVPLITNMLPKKANREA